MQLKAIALVVGLAACGKGSQCKQAVQHMIDLASAEGDKKANAETMKQFATVGDALTGACEQDKWSSEVTDCMKAANDFKAQRACERLLTPEQTKHTEDVVQNAAGIHHKPHEETKGPADKDPIAAMTDQRDRMCACADAACAEAVNKERDALVKPEKDFMKFNDLDDERAKCYHKATGK